ncbi:hypothetical protein BRW84_02610 [Oxalobacter formigenes OXCC13]|nr:hypothetical protein BRW83_0589 [Oxalobacter formigenes]ARQ77638.1 hypothetical protein BRW84_02610 [Oxalobacter formigenes OXCC13]
MNVARRNATIDKGFPTGIYCRIAQWNVVPVYKNPEGFASRTQLSPCRKNGIFFPVGRKFEPRFSLCFLLLQLKEDCKNQKKLFHDTKLTTA